MQLPMVFLNMSSNTATAASLAMVEAFIGGWLVGWLVVNLKPSYHGGQFWQHRGQLWKALLKGLAGVADWGTAPESLGIPDTSEQGQPQGDQKNPGSQGSDLETGGGGGHRFGW